MSEAIPLGATLRVQSVSIVIGDTRDETLDVMLELFPSKGRVLWDIHRQAVIYRRVKITCVEGRMRDMPRGKLTPIEPSLQFECHTPRPSLAGESGDSIGPARHMSV